jgi:hypothetical protein
MIGPPPLYDSFLSIFHVVPQLKHGQAQEDSRERQTNRLQWQAIAWFDVGAYEAPR